MNITAAFLLPAVLAVLANVAPVNAQPANSPASSAKPGSVDGVVTNSVTGEPVRKAVVALRGSTGVSYQAVTDAAGHFHADKVDPATYSITAVRDGFVIQQPRAGGKKFTVGEEQNVSDIALNLVPLAVVSGHVLDDDGEPVVLARVVALRTFYNNGRRRLAQVGAARSNDLGEFQFINLEAARYYFRVSAPSPANLPPRTRTSRPETAYPTTYYPAALDLGQASAVNLAPGAQVSGIEFRLRKQPAYHVRGKLLDGQAGGPARSATVALAPDSVEFLPYEDSQAGVQPDGTFDLPAIVNGSYVLSAQSHNAAETSARQHVRISGEDVSVLLTLAPGFEVAGRVTVEGPAPAQMNARVTLRAERFGNGYEAQVSSDGTFKVENVTPNSYRIDVFPGAAGLYVKSIRLGDQEISDGFVNITQPGVALHILFGVDVAQVQGTVEAASGEPMPNSLVTLGPSGRNDNRPDLVKQTNTDQYGHFKFPDLAPGDYLVFAWAEDSDRGLLENTDFLKLLSSQAASVSVGPNGSEAVQLKPISAGDIEQAKNKLP